MSNVQVLNRVDDQSVQNMNEATRGIADTLYRQQALKMTGQYYKIMAKNAQTEEDKAHMDRLAKLNSDILPDIQATQDPTLRAMKIKAIVESGQYGGDAQQFFHDIANSHPQVNSNYQALQARDAQNPMTPNAGAYGQSSQGSQQTQGGQQPQGGQIDPSNPYAVQATKNQYDLHQAQLQDQISTGMLAKQAEALGIPLNTGSQQEAQQQPPQAPDQSMQSPQSMPGLPPQGSTPLSAAMPIQARLQAMQGQGGIPQGNQPAAPGMTMQPGTGSVTPNTAPDAQQGAPSSDWIYGGPKEGMIYMPGVIARAQAEAQGTAQGQAVSPKVAPQQTEELRNIEDALSKQSDMESLYPKIEKAGIPTGAIGYARGITSGGTINPNLYQYMQERDDYAQKVWQATHPSQTWRPTLAAEARKLVYDPTTQDPSLAPSMFATNRAALNDRANAASQVPIYNATTGTVGNYPPGSPADKQQSLLNQLGEGTTAPPPYDPTKQKLLRSNRTGKYKVILR